MSPLGEEQQKELGLWIRRRYVEHFKLLDTVVHSKAMKIFSTDKNRTVQSAKFNLFGMYGLNVVGVPIQIRDKSKDFYGVPADSCDRLKSLLGLLKTTFEYKALDTQNRVKFQNCWHNYNTLLLGSLPQTKEDRQKASRHQVLSSYYLQDLGYPFSPKTSQQEDRL